MGGGDASHLPKLTKETAPTIGRLGGLVCSDKKKWAQLLEKSPTAKCKNCKALCIFKKQNLEENNNTTCIVPDARAKAIWYKMPIMSEEVLDKLDAEALLVMTKKCQTPAQIKLLLDAINQKKKTDYPKIIDTRNVNVNVDWTSAVVEAHKEMKEKEEKVVNQVKEDKEEVREDGKENRI